jgi:hypothetical protein
VFASSLRESGLSIRAIAAATGMSHGAIGNEVSKYGHLPPTDPLDVEADGVEPVDRLDAISRRPHGSRRQPPLMVAKEAVNDCPGVRRYRRQCRELYASTSQG